MNTKHYLFPRLDAQSLQRNSWNDLYHGERRLFKEEGKHMRSSALQPSGGEEKQP